MDEKTCFLCEEKIEEVQSRVMHTECKYVHRKCEEAYKNRIHVGRSALLKVQLDRLLCVVNAVTCPHRHGQPIRPKDLTRLVDRQISVEEALRKMEF